MGFYFLFMDVHEEEYIVDKKFWILVPMQSDEGKKKFENFIYERTGNKTFRVGTQYSNGFIMLLVAPDLKHFDMTNITCGYMADVKTRGADDFIERYDEIKRAYDIVAMFEKETASLEQK
jgi:hypothetical protein